MDLRSQNLRPYDSGHEDLLMFEDVPQFEENSSFGLEESFEEYPAVVLEGEFQERRTILADGGDHYGVTALAFDLQEELLWMGNQGGHVTSYYGSELQKHTSFQVHANEDIRCLHTIDDGILALTPSSLRCQMRRGIPIFTHTSNNLDEMQCLLQLSQSPHTLLLGGHSRKLVEFNLNQGQEINLVEVGENGCAILRQHPRFICCGDPTGQITLRDPTTLAIEHSLDTHTGSLSDFDVHGNHLVTCGFSNRQGGLSVDRFLMVYDVRMMRAISPIPVLLDPLLLKFMPSFSSRIAVASTIGQLQLIDTVTLSEPDLTVYQINSTNAICLALDVSTSCQSLAIGDSGGSIHLLTSTNNAIFNAFSRPTEFADPIETYPPMNIDDPLAILSSVPLPYLQSTKLSDWPQQFLNKVYRRTPPIDQEIIQTMKMQGTIGYAPNPNKKLRNQVAYLKDSKGQNMTNNSIGGGQTRNNKDEQINNTTNAINSSTNTTVTSGGNGTFVAIPKRYRKIEYKFAKPGVVDDCDCTQFNKTCFSGLEATLPNSYCNPILQVLYFLEPLRQVLLSHLCYNEFCLSCELSFLFHMLDVAKGIPCHSGNFLRSLRNAHEATALGLILPDQNSGSDTRRKTNFVSLIQNWNRFILHQIHYELLEERKRKQKETPRPAFIYKDTDFPSIELQARTRRKPRPDNSDGTTLSSNVESKDAETEISRLFGSKQLHIHRCLKCSREVSRESSLLVCNLIYPEDAEGEYSFCEVLRSSLCPEQTTPAWCDQCERFQPTLQSRRLQVLPSFLTVNCGMDNTQEKRFWQNQMDCLVKRALEISTNVETTTTTARHSPITSKPCRYGTGCTRPGCRFKHPGQNSDSTTNTTTNSNATSHLYCSHSWLPQHIQLDLASSGEVSIKKLDKTEVEAIDLNTLKSSGRQTVVYDLCAVVCYVHEEKKNLVAIINVDTAYHSRASGQNISQWYIFNDFSIAPVTGQEAVWFSLDWKVPCILYWMDRTLEQPDASVMNPITADVLSEDISLARSGKGITFTPLTADETPGPGDLVAMDAEFVTLNQEESELRSDGKLATIKPSHMSVARISCIRGQGSLKGTPFIDDYISTQEEVVDYLTQFSGIKPGDLDATCSSKHLTTLKSTYLKLRYLIDNGVKFVGHGLRNDFRVINLVVPSDQVIDTVHLFHLPHQRMVSLRFLAWHFLGMKIQSETHDSIEDARAALQLYECYKLLESENKLQASLEELYKVGKSVQWKVPGVDS